MELLDPDLNENYDEVEMRRMVVAASLCITRRARLRPQMREVTIGHKPVRRYDSLIPMFLFSLCLDTDTYPSARGGGHGGTDEMPR